jgi:DmsE family decaheme c-type cytochrome
MRPAGCPIEGKTDSDLPPVSALRARANAPIGAATLISIKRTIHKNLTLRARFLACESAVDSGKFSNPLRFPLRHLRADSRCAHPKTMSWHTRGADMHDNSCQRPISQVRYLTALAIAAVIGLCAGVTPRLSLAADEDMVKEKVCNRCHEEQVDALQLNVHSRTSEFGQGEASCQGCHGPGRVHSKSQEASDIINPKNLANAESTQTCLNCHDDTRTFQHWAGSVHEANEVTCIGCHNFHGGNRALLVEDTEVETCLNCHREQRSALRKRSTHPLHDASHADGVDKMSCTSCHGPHGTIGEKLISANTINEKCYECHEEKKAPVLWEHSVVKENCLACHNPHGSNHEMMLTAKQPRLCQQCHEQGRHQTIAGQPGSFMAVNRGCSNCHASIHGTNNPSGIKLKN